MQFTLSATSPVAGATSAVRIDLRDGRGQVVLSLRARAGETVSADTAFLPPGPYAASVTLEPGPNGQLDEMRYRLQGASLSNPIGPAISNALLTPQYKSENDPTLFVYPGAWSSGDPFFWMLIDPAGYLVIPGAGGTSPVNAYPVVGGEPLLTPP
jgi:hypothetical protein